MQHIRITLKVNPNSGELLNVAAAIAKPSEGRVEMRRNKVYCLFMSIPLRDTIMNNTSELKIAVHTDTDKPKKLVEKNI